MSYLQANIRQVRGICLYFLRLEKAGDSRLQTSLWASSPFIRLYCHHVPLRSPIAPGLHVLLQAGRLAGAVPRSGPEDPAAQETDVHRPGEDPRACQARRGLGNIREPADARARDRHRQRWGLPEANARAVREVEARVMRVNEH
jgi:hypothetical protein